MQKLSRRAGAGERSRGCLLRRLTRQLDSLVATVICLCLNLASSMAVSRSWAGMASQETGDPSELSPTPLHLGLVRHLMSAQSCWARG